MKISFLLLMILVCGSLGVTAQDSPEEGSPSNLFKGKTYVKNPLDLRDPFKRKANKKRSSKKKEQGNGYYTNFNQSLEGKPLENLQVVGVVIGPERRAIMKVIGDVKDKENTIFYVKEGMKIGSNGAEVKAILPGGIVLVEKIRNVYDQDEYLETVIPVSE